MTDFVLERDYLDTENIPRAVATAFGVVQALRRHEIDWSMRRTKIAFALQVLCDAQGGSPEFAYNSVALAQPDLRDPHRWENEGRIERAVRRACDLTIMAEVAHRCERYAQAIVWCEVAFDELLGASPDGDQATLLKLASSSKRNPLAAALKAVLAIWMPAVRRSSRPPQVKEYYYHLLDPFIDALIASGQVYERSHAFGAQGMFRDAERLRGLREPSDREVVRLADLRDISESNRGSSKRAMATAPLVEMEYLRATRDLDGAQRAAALARELLIDFGLPRHLDRMTKYRYLSFD